MAYGDSATYIDVDADIKDLQKMLDCSGGRMAVPVIVEGERVTIGFGGGVRRRLHLNRSVAPRGRAEKTLRFKGIERNPSETHPDVRVSLHFSLPTSIVSSSQFMNVRPVSCSQSMF